MTMAGDMLIDIDLGIEPPDEGLPITVDAEDDWETDDDGDNEKTLYQHYFSSKNAPTGQQGWHAPRVDYQTRIETERSHWIDQEEELTLAYMKWKVYGPGMESEGVETDSFDCRVVALRSKSLKEFCCVARADVPHIA